MIESSDLTGVEAPLPRQCREVGDPPGPRRFERCRRPLRLGLEGLDLMDTGVELEGQALQLGSAVPGIPCRLGPLASALLELVEAGDGGVGRPCVEEDGDSIRVSLL